MKICWDNLEKLEYKNGFWYDNKRYHYYIYKDSCKNCHVEVHKQPDCGYHDMRCS